MAITLADFNKIWSSTSPLSPYTFSDDNYNEGWNFIGQIPPSRQMWDFLQKNNDEKMQYLANNYLPLSGGTITGAIKGNPVTLTADDGNGNTASLVANPNGDLTWNGKNVLTDGFVGTSYTAAWTATESNANNQQLTDKIENVPVGVYIFEAKLPFFTNNDYYMALSKSGASTILDGGLGRMFSQQCATRVIKVTSATNSFWLQSAQGAACSFSYLERGGLALTRIG